MRLTQIVSLLCLAVPARQQSTPIGLIVDANKYGRSVNVLQTAITDSKNVSGTYSFTFSTGNIQGCGTGLQEGNGAFLLTQDYYQQNISAVFGPTCYSDLEITGTLAEKWNILEFNFWQDHPSDLLENTVVQMTSRSAVNVAMNIYAAITNFNWARLSIVYCPTCMTDLGLARFRMEYVISFLSSKGIDILSKRTIQSTDTLSDIITVLNDTKANSRIYLPLLGDNITNYVTFMEAASEAGLDPSIYVVVIAISLYSIKGLQLPWTDPNSEMKNIFDNTVIIYNNFFDPTAVQNFASRIGADATQNSQILFYIHLYESLLLYSNTVGQYGVPSNASYLIQQAKNTQVQGPFGAYYLNYLTQRITPFTIAYIHPNYTTPLDVAKMTIVPQDCSTGSYACVNLKAIALPAAANLTSNMPLDMPVCGFTGELCEQTSTILVIVGIIVGIFFFVITYFVYRRVKSQEVREMPWAITRDSIRLIDIMNTSLGSQQLPSYRDLQNADANRPPSSRAGRQSATEPPNSSREAGRMKVPHMRKLATVNNAYVTVETYVFLEKRHDFDKNEVALFHQMKQSVHDNINAFIGASFETSELLILWAQCFRGTLDDVLLKKRRDERETAAAHNFQGAFVRDILKGLEFIHTSGMSYHGGLTANNCLVDSHWILKLSGFGVNRMLFRWKHRRMIQTLDRGPIIPNSELYYYAPEMRIAWKTAQTAGTSELYAVKPEEGRRADMYAVGILLYEILYMRKFVELNDESGRKFFDIVQGDISTDPKVENPNSREDNDNESSNVIFTYDTETLIPSIPTIPDASDVHPDLLGLMQKLWSVIPDIRPDLSLARRITDATLKMSGSLVDQMLKNLETYNSGLEEMVAERTKALAEEQKKADNLLTELLPRSVADELRAGRRVDAKQVKSATILYSDIVGFTSLCSESEPMEVVVLLSGVFQAFDRIITHHNTYKVETIGDAYMIASGIPEPSKNHVKEIASVALMNREFLRSYEIPHRPGQHLHCRWGFNTGPVSTGVVGFSAPRYCVFGSTVTIAAKMESMGVPDKIQMTVESHRVLTTRFPEFKCSPRGNLQIDGIGVLLTYFLDGVEELLMSDREAYRNIVDQEVERVKRNAITAVARRSATATSVPPHSVSAPAIHISESSDSVRYTTKSPSLADEDDAS